MRMKTGHRWKTLMLPLLAALALVGLSAAQAQLGRQQEAASAEDKLQKVLPGIITISFVEDLPLCSYKNQADRDRLLAGLRMAGMLETPYDALRKTKKP